MVSSADLTDLNTAVPIADEPERMMTDVPALEIPDSPDNPDRIVSERALRDVICPECGQAARVTMNRRAAEDFCVRCDYPLFWTSSDVLLDVHSSGESLRRLPGAVGQQRAGSVACPHCAERNVVAAEVCVRCGGDMVLPVPPPPPPAPAPVAAPPEVVEAPEPEPAPDRFWVWVSIAAGVGVAILLAFLLVTLIRSI